MAEHTNPLAEVLQDYIRSKWPEVRSYTDLAKQIGLSHATIYSWINGDRRPELSTLMTVATKTGIPFKRLAAAAGYPPAPDADDVFDRMLRELDERSDFDEEERAAIRRFIEELRGRESDAQDGAQAAVAC